PRTQPTDSVLGPAPPLSTHQFPTQPKLPIKKLTPAEMQAKREKGHCFNCDEKLSVGHRCKGRMSLLLLEGELDDSDVVEVLDSEPTISLHAFLGDVSPLTIRLKGVVNGKAICILIDGGSTHNFI
ncbi:hypothetical protein CFOL_v3_01786, partial [Cephalotus follicularis]